MINERQLKAKMIIENVTVEEVCEALSINASTFYRWLNNSEKITVGSVEKISRLLHLNGQELMSIFYPNFVA